MSAGSDLTPAEMSGCFFCETNEDESRAAEGASSGSCCPFQAGELESKLLHKRKDAGEQM